MYKKIILTKYQRFRSIKTTEKYYNNYKYLSLITITLIK